MPKLNIGVDIGGSHITCIAVDPEDHTIKTDFQVRREIDCHGSAGSILGNWTLALEELIRKIGLENLAGIGFAMPGPFDYPNGIALFSGVKKYDHLNGIDVRSEIRQRLNLSADIPVRFLNDATSFAIGEAWIGKGKEYDKVMAITLGTGFGSAFLSGGIPVENGPDVPEYGCVYHLPYKNSIANDYFSTSWFIDRYKELTGKEVSGVKEIADMTTTVYTFDIQNSTFDIRYSTELFKEFGTALGQFLLPWLQKFDAGCLVIGGNIANSFSLFEKSLKAALAGDPSNLPSVPFPVFLSELGELAAIAGAARLCDDTFYNRLPFFSGK